MPVPSNTPALTLGRPVFDARKFRPDTDPAVIEALKMLAMTIGGAGAPGPAKSGDTTYQSLYGKYVDPDWFIYAGNPSDPTNPDLVTSPFSGSTSISVTEEGGASLGSFSTLNFVGATITATNAGGGVADITVTSGAGTVSEAFKTIQVSGQSDVVADSATDTLTLVAQDGMEITTNSSLDAIGFAVKAHTYIDVSSNGVAVDFTEVASYNGAADQYLRNNAGTFEWATLPPDTNTTYTAGAGVNLSGTKFVADPHDASHVGLVDPTTGDDSSADDAQIGILWHEIENFDNGRNQLHGHVADDATKPKVTCKTTEDWLALLENYDSADHQIIGNDPTKAGGEGTEKVRWLDAPQKVLWCIDPDGGHTITTSGTTLTLTLKVTKYTFDAVNFVSAVDADVTVTYEGTECP